MDHSPSSLGVGRSCLARFQLGFTWFTRDSRGDSRLSPARPRTAKVRPTGELRIVTHVGRDGRTWAALGLAGERCESLRESLIKYVNPSRNRAKQLRPTPRELGERSFQSWSSADRKSMGFRGPLGCLHREKAPSLNWPSTDLQMDLSRRFIGVGRL